MSQEEIKDLYDEYVEVPKTASKCLKRQFEHWPAGTSQEEIHRWFDIHYHQGLDVLRFGEEEIL